MPKLTKTTVPKDRIQQIESLLKKINLDSSRINLSSIEFSKGYVIFDEALTHTSAKKVKNYENLEFLGDAVLRLAASEFIDIKFPEMEVGERSALRAQLVSDRWLETVGKRIEIMKLLIIGPQTAKDLSAHPTLEAEATEALIGAIYKCLKSLEPIHQWLEPFWAETSKVVLADPHRQNSKSALQEWSQAKGLNRPKYKTEEQNEKHGDPRRFFCKVFLGEHLVGNGWGGSRRAAEKEAALKALEKLNNSLEQKLTKNSQKA